MSAILCATRGGKDSYPTQDKAIALAKERDEIILYLFVVDLNFLNRTAAPIVVDVETELTELGEFMLLVAKERAADQGVLAKTALRTGKLREELVDLAREEDISLIILGKPAGKESTFQETELQAFAAGIKEETGIETRIV